MENAPVNFFAVPHTGLYVTVLAAAFILCGLWFILSAQKKKLPAPAAPVCLATALLAGGFLARLLYLTVEVGSLPLIAEMFMKPEDVREFGFAGAVLGLILSVWATQKLFHTKGLSDAAALPALLMVLLARLASACRQRSSPPLSQCVFYEPLSVSRPTDNMETNTFFICPCLCRRHRYLLFPHMSAIWPTSYIQHTPGTFPCQGLHIKIGIILPILFFVSRLTHGIIEACKRAYNSGRFLQAARELFKKHPGNAAREAMPCRNF